MVYIVMENKGGGVTSVGVLLVAGTANVKRPGSKSGLGVGLAKATQSDSWPCKVGIAEKNFIR